jgi:heme/copper-type cytochrome/quinol oxidase subunit 4
MIVFTIQLIAYFSTIYLTLRTWSPIDHGPALGIALFTIFTYTISYIFAVINTILLLIYFLKNKIKSGKRLKLMMIISILTILMASTLWYIVDYSN